MSDTGKLIYAPTTGKLVYDPATDKLIYDGPLPPPPGTIYVTFSGSITIYLAGTWVVFEGGKYTLTGGPTTWSYGSGFKYITMNLTAGLWYCRIGASWGSYGSGYTQWVASSIFGLYSFHLNYGVDPPYSDDDDEEEDAVTNVEVTEE